MVVSNFIELKCFRMARFGCAGFILPKSQDKSESDLVRAVWCLVPKNCNFSIWCHKAIAARAGMRFRPWMHISSFAVGADIQLAIILWISGRTDRAIFADQDIHQFLAVSTGHGFDYSKKAVIKPAWNLHTVMAVRAFKLVCAAHMCSFTQHIITGANKSSLSGKLASICIVLHLEVNYWFLHFW